MTFNGDTRSKDSVRFTMFADEKLDIESCRRQIYLRWIHKQSEVQRNINIYFSCIGFRILVLFWILLICFFFLFFKNVIFYFLFATSAFSEADIIIVIITSSRSYSSILCHAWPGNLSITLSFLYDIWCVTGKSQATFGSISYLDCLLFFVYVTYAQQYLLVYYPVREYSLTWYCLWYLSIECCVFLSF